MFRGPKTCAGEPNCGTVLIAPVGSPFCRRLMVPPSVRASQSVLVLVMLLKSTDTSRLRAPKFTFLNTRRSAAVRVGSRYDPSGSTLTVRVAAHRLRRDDLPRDHGAALRVQVAGEADVVPRQDVGARHLELVRPIADLTGDRAGRC